MAKIKSVQTKSGDRVQLGSKAYSQAVSSGDSPVSGTGKNLTNRDIKSVGGGYTDKVSTTLAKRTANAAGELLPYQEFNQKATAIPEAPEMAVPGTSAQSIDATQPSPASVNATPFTRPSPAVAPPVTAPLATPASTPTPAQIGFNAAMASGADVPTNPGAARAAVATYMPPAAPAPTVADTLVAEDPFFAQIQQQFQEYFSPKKQRESLVQEYDRLMKKSGIEALDMELVSMKNIIDGSEEDLRLEVTKSSGFATESQILALTSARNKVLLKNYNALLDTRDAKQQYLDKMMTLASEDRKQADANFDRMMNFTFQVQNYKEKMQTNARNAYQKIADTVGYDGLLQMTGGDPTNIALMERTLGLNPGGLAQLSAISAKDRAAKEADAALDRQIKQLTAANIRSQIAERGKKEDRVLSVTEAKELGVPYGTTESQAAKKGIVPGQTDTKASTADLYEKVKLIDSLEKSSGLNSRVGPNPTTRSKYAFVDSLGAGQNFAAGVQTLTSQETLNQLLNLKAKGGTLGALSEGERIELKQAATKIGAWEIRDEKGNGTGEWNVDEGSFRQELRRLKNLTYKAIAENIGYNPNVVPADDVQEIEGMYGETSVEAPFNPESYY